MQIIDGKEVECPTWACTFLPERIIKSGYRYNNERIGKAEGRGKTQRYKCLNCGVRFIEYYAQPMTATHLRISDGVISGIIYLRDKGLSFRNIAKELNKIISYKTAWRICKLYGIE